MVLLALLALATFFSFDAAAYAMIGSAAAFAFVVLWRMDVAFLVLLGELFAGATGNIFSASFHGVRISLRLVFFIIFILVWLTRLRKEDWSRLTRHPLCRWFLAFLGALILGMVVGLLRGNAFKTAFLDANGYIAVLLFPVMLTQIRTAQTLRRVLQVLFAATVFHALWTYVLLLVFSSHSQYVTEVYKWIRDSRIYEVTEYPGNFFRVFSAAHFPVMAGTLLAGTLLWHRSSQASAAARRKLFSIFFAGFGTLIIGASRSFLLALSVVLILFLILLVRRIRPSMRSVYRTAGTALAILAAELVVIAAVITAGTLIQGKQPALSFSVLEERVADAGEPALAHRYALLSPLLRAITEHPILGSGFGRTVTFITTDPRIVERTGGVRTTYAFEWGYLDLLLKLGVIGAAAVLGFLWACVRLLRRTLATAQPQRQPLLLAFLLAVCTLALVHMTSPYLNHPIGLSMLALAAAAATVSLPEHEERA